jgi:hypothetical protein
MKFLASRWVLAPICVVAFGALCWDSSVRLAAAYPTYFTCIEDPAKYEGKPIWLSPSYVLRAHDDSFELDYWDKTVRVRTPDPAPAGMLVMVYGTFRSDGTVEATNWKEEKYYRTKRRGVILVSIFVLAIGVAIFHRTFAWRGGSFHEREHHSAVAPQKPMDGN